MPISESDQIIKKHPRCIAAVGWHIFKFLPFLVKLTSNMLIYKGILFLETIFVKNNNQ